MGDLTHSLLAHLIFHQIEGPDIGLFLAYSWGRVLHWFAKIHFHFLTGYRVTLHFPKLSADNRTSGTAFLLMEYNDEVCITSETRLSGCVHACSDLSPPSAPAAKWLWCWSCFNHGGYGHARKWESRIVEWVLEWPRGVELPCLPEQFSLKLWEKEISISWATEYLLGFFVTAAYPYPHWCTPDYKQYWCKHFVLTSLHI